jgi:elongation factor G
VNQIKGGVIPQEYVPSVDKGIQIAMEQGTYIGSPVVGVRALVNDGSTHPVDSSDQAFQTAGLGAFRATYDKAKPIALEPIMKVVVEGPTEFQGNIFATLNQRRGVIIASNEDGLFSVVEAEVPLAEMFGFSTVLRSLTQGKAEYSMEFAKYGKVPQSIAEELREKYLKSKQEGNK